MMHIVIKKFTLFTFTLPYFLRYSLCLLIFCCFVSHFSFAQNGVVNYLTDNYTAGELRYEIENCNPGDTIWVNIKGDVPLTQSINVNNSCFIVGPHALHMNVLGSGLPTSGSIFSFPNSNVTVFVHGFTFSGLSVNRRAFVMLNTSDNNNIQVDRCLFIDNSTTGASGTCFFMNQTGSTLSVSNSSFVNNSGAMDGGVVNIVNGSGFFLNNSFDGNTSGTGNGGAISFSNGNLTLINNTFYNNTGNFGQVLVANSGSVTLQNNIFINPGSAPADLITGSSALWTSLGGNIARTAGFPTSPVGTDNVSSTVDPLLGGLITDGFGMMYRPIGSSSSPAINIGNPGSLPVFDARMSYRTLEVFGTKLPDAGAIEYSRHTVTSTNGGTAVGSLGSIVADLNASGQGPYSIVFEIPSSPYSITHNVAGTYVINQPGTTINGYTQEGSQVAGPGIPGSFRYVANPVVTLNGGGAAISGFDFSPSANGCMVAGLSFTGHNTAALKIEASDVSVEGNHVGLNNAANGVSSNTTGILISGAPTGVSVGKRNYLLGVHHSVVNVISGNSEDQIRIAGGQGVIIRNNLIGLDGSGLLNPGNPPNSVGIKCDGGNGHLIGGLYGTQRNYISGNHFAGIVFKNIATAHGTTVIGNFIGPNVLGTSAVPNGKGIEVESGASGVNVGGESLNKANLISGNTGAGIELNGAFSNNVKGNWIGLAITGITALANDKGIVLRNGASDNYIGGNVSGEGNLISGNTNGGIEITDAGTTGNMYHQNVIGLDSSGSISVANGYGVVIANNAVEIIGGPGLFPNYGNVISGNTNLGIGIDATCTNIGIQIQGNIIGLQRDGLNVVPSSSQDGVVIATNTSVKIGDGSRPGPSGGGNIISGNGSGKYGVKLDGDNHIAQANWIGIKGDGSSGVGNDFGIGVFGNNNIVGGGLHRQIISSNQTGVIITGASNNSVNHNFIGTDTSGTLIGFGNVVGVKVDGGATSNLLGAAVDKSNVISGNDTGILIEGLSTGNNYISGNFIGVSESGLSLIPNSTGIELKVTSSNYIGNNLSAISFRNIIGGNSIGILIDSSNSNILQGNFIGVFNDATNSLIPNATGIKLDNNSLNNGIGQPGGNINLISGNIGPGVHINASSSNTVANNHIGCDFNGTVERKNYQGVILSGGSNGNTIGGVAVADRNIISGNYYKGIWVRQAGTNNNSIKGNYIGTDITGTVALPNPDGIYIDTSANSNMIGGTAPIEGNLISGNSSTGITLKFSNSNNILNNIIGPDKTGNNPITGLTNFMGVSLVDASSTNVGLDTSMKNIISANRGAGVFMAGNSSFNLIRGNFIGTSRNGTVALGNAQGVYISGNSNTNQVGGNVSGGEMNLISGNTDRGVWMDGTSGTVTNNAIYNNIVGLDIAGLNPIPNVYGVYGNKISNFAVGDSGVFKRNIISANTASGVFIEGISTNIQVKNNYIGSNINGLNPGNNMGNGAEGVIFTTGVSNSLIGGDNNAGQGNVIVNNDNGIILSGASLISIKGNNIGVAADGISAMPNDMGIIIDGNANAASNNLIGGNVGSGEENVIAGNREFQIGIDGANATNNVVNGNLVGVNRNYADITPNSANGIGIRNAALNVIGGSLGSNHNIISGCDTAVVIMGGSDLAVKGNYIGTNETGLSAVPNGVGIFIFNGTQNSVIGGSVAGDKNIISGNLNEAIVILGNTTGNIALENNVIGLKSDISGLLGNGYGLKLAGTKNNLIGPNNHIAGNITNIGLVSSDSNVIAGNKIGYYATFAAGDEVGVGLSASNYNIIGGNTAALQNYIAGNNAASAGVGIALSNTSTNNLIRNNTVGNTDAGTGIANNIGIVLTQSNDNILGEVGAGNVVVNNNGIGIFLENSSNLLLISNRIGLDGGGAAAGNGSAGIGLANCSDIQIGGYLSNQQNTIANNGAHGIMFSATAGASSTKIDIEANSFFDNAGLAIDLGNNGITSNDSGDADTGDNLLQNFPVLESVFNCSGSPTTTVVQSLDFAVGTYRIDYYRPDGSDAEGQVWLDSAIVNVTVSGQRIVTQIPSQTIGDKIISTATDINGNTSEFGLFRTVGSSPTPPVINANQTICFGASPAPLTSSGNSGTTVWFSDGGVRLDTGATYQPNLTTPGSFGFLAQDSIAGCLSTSSNTVIITVAGALTVPISGADSLCELLSADYYVSPSGAGPYNFNWSLSSNNGSVLGDATQDTCTVTSGSFIGGKDTLIVSVSDVNGCISSDTLLIQVIDGPSANAGADQSLCSNNNGTNLNGTINNASGGLWTSSGTGLFSPAANLLSTSYSPSSSDLATGNIFLTLTTTGNGLCNAASDVLEIIYTAAPVFVMSNDTAVCPGNSVPVSASISNATGVVWSTTGSGSFSSPTTSASVYALGSGDNGTIFLVATSTGNGNCNAVSDTVELTVNTVPNSTLISGSSSVCAMDTSVVYVASGNSASTFTWDINVGHQINPTSPSSTAGVNFGVGNAVIAVQETNVEGCVGNQVTFSVVVNDLPNIDAGSDQTICEGEAITLSGSGGTSYAWTGGVVDGSSFVPLFPGSDYWVEGMDSNGCKNKDSVTVFVNPIPQVAITPRNIRCFGENSGVLHFDIISTSGPFILMLNGIQFTSANNIDSIFGLPQNNYNFYVQDTSNCQSVIHNFDIIEPPQVNASVVPFNPICFGAGSGRIKVVGSGGTGNNFSYSINNGNDWSNAIDSAFVAFGLTSGNYQVSARDSNGCVSSVQDIVLVDPPAITASFVVLADTCEQGVGSIEVVNVNNNQGPLLYISPQGSSLSSLLNGIYSGDNFIRVRDSAGCNLDTVINVTNSLAAVPPVDNYGVGGPYVLCPGETVFATSFGATSVTWYIGDNELEGDSVEITGVFSITYNVLLNIGGCLIDDVLGVEVKPLSDCVIDAEVTNNAFSPNDDGKNETFKIDIPFLSLYDNRVIFFNKWGDQIALINNYNNDDIAWNGTNSNGRSVTAGTYYYVIEIQQLNFSRSGWVQVVK